MILHPKARVQVTVTLPDARQLSYTRILDDLELDELVLLTPPPFIPDDAAGHFLAIQWDERRERARRMCESVGQSIAFALQQALLDGKAKPG